MRIFFVRHRKNFNYYMYLKISQENRSSKFWNNYLGRKPKLLALFLNKNVTELLSGRFVYEIVSDLNKFCAVWKRWVSGFWQPNFVKIWYDFDGQMKTLSKSLEFDSVFLKTDWCRRLWKTFLLFRDKMRYKSLKNATQHC